MTTLCWLNWRGLFTRQRATLAVNKLLIISVPMAYFLLLLLTVTFLRIQMTWQPIILSIIHNKCITLPIHYSQVQYFFLTPRKCNIFGVHCEAIPRQVNFLTDEAADCGKGANVVISQLHYFFSHHGLGEK